MEVRKIIFEDHKISMLRKPRKLIGYATQLDNQQLSSLLSIERLDNSVMNFQVFKRLVLSNA
jgi:hypothetical protein